MGREQEVGRDQEVGRGQELGLGQEVGREQEKANSFRSQEEGAPGDSRYQIILITVLVCVFLI